MSTLKTLVRIHFWPPLPPLAFIDYYVVLNGIYQPLFLDIYDFRVFAMHSWMELEFDPEQTCKEQDTPFEGH